MTDSLSKETERVVKAHLHLFFKQDYDALMSYYTAESIVVGYGKVYRGLKEIRSVMEEAGKQWMGSAAPFKFHITFESFNGSMGYVQGQGYNAVNQLPFFCSTYQVINGKILYESAGRLAMRWEPGTDLKG